MYIYMSALDFKNDITSAIDRGLKIIGISMEPSKAFDTIDHIFNYTKKRKYGFRGLSHN